MSRNADAASIVPAKVLRRDLSSGDLAQVLIDVAGIDALPMAIVIEILKQLLARQLLAVLHDAGDASVRDRYRVRHAALAAKFEAQLGAGHLDVSSSERREAERPVVACVFIAADADQRLLEQPHDRRQDFVPRQRRCGDVLLDAMPDGWEDFAELEQAAELRVVANFAVSRVVAVLLATPRIARGDLQMASGRRADPHVGPSRRNHELADALQLSGVANLGAVRSRVREPAPAPPTSDAGTRVGHVPQTGGLRRFNVFVRERHRRSAAPPVAPQVIVAAGTSSQNCVATRVTTDHDGFRVMRRLTRKDATGRTRVALGERRTSRRKWTAHHGRGLRKEV